MYSKTPENHRGKRLSSFSTFSNCKTRYTARDQTFHKTEIDEKKKIQNENPNSSSAQDLHNRSRGNARLYMPALRTSIQGSSMFTGIGKVCP